MKFRGFQRFALFTHYSTRFHLRQRVQFTTFLRKVQSSGSSSNGSSQGKSLLVPGATVATIVMLGALHARRLYSDNKIEEAREKGIELEFKPDVKAQFLRLLPLRSISRCWGYMSSVELPEWMRPYVHRAWSRAFHSNLEEAALPLEEYASLRDFFIRTLKEGSRPINRDPRCLISPVDGTVLRFGELKEAGGMIEQVKGCSYSVSSLLGATSLHAGKDIQLEEADDDQLNHIKDETKKKKSWWNISLASPKVRGPEPARAMKGLFYCVIYLKPGDYHRIHSPVDWNIFGRRHFSGRLYPVNERATRTIKNVFVENERVVVEGQWEQGYMAMAAIGATNIGSIELFIEPSLHTNMPQKKLLHPDRPDERIYEPEGTGVVLKKGDELGAFNMGSTVVMVFQAPTSQSTGEDFKFCVKKGDRIQMGQALGALH